jgi:hypothetical protein
MSLRLRPGENRRPQAHRQTISFFGVRLASITLSRETGRGCFVWSSEKRCFSLAQSILSLLELIQPFFRKTMAARYEFTCDRCGFSVEAWDDGNPYIEYPKGKRHHFYHPGEDEQIKEITRTIVGHEPTRQECDNILKKYGGNESDFICRSCLKIDQYDESKDPLVCKHCGGESIERTFDLAGKKCLKCDGIFSEGEFTAIS